MQDRLCTDTLVGALFNISINGHHVVLAVQLKPMPSKEEQSVDIFTQERCKILQCLVVQGDGGRGIV